MYRRTTALLTFLCVTAAGCGGDAPDRAARGTFEEPDRPRSTMTSNRTRFRIGTDNPAPAAEQRPVTIGQHGETRTDQYAWLRDANWQEVLRDPSKLSPDIRAHLEAENRYYEAATAELDGRRETLVAEMRGRIREDDSAVPLPDGPWAYSVRYRKGGQYPVFVRTPRDGGAETVLFDGDEEGEGEDFFDIGAVEHSPDHRWIAYGLDRTGSEYYDIRVRNIATGEEFDETITSTDGGAVWAAYSRSFYYIERDDHQRPKRVKHHVLGTDPADDRLVYEEPDDSFFLDVSKSLSGEYIFITSSKVDSSEARFVPADAPPGAQPVLIAPRRDDEIYQPEHHGEHFYLHTNADGAVDFKIARAPVADPGRDNWEDWLPHRPGTYLVDFVTFADRLVRLERENALPRIVVSDYEGEVSYPIDFEEAAYALGLEEGYEFDARTVRFSYESPATPEQVWDFDMFNRERTLRKTQEVPSGHRPELYAVERIFVEARDGAEVPVTILRLADTPTDGSAPLVLYGYGSYGLTMPAHFSTNTLSLVDRGIVYAIAHIRGGAAKGRQWYLDGKLGRKMNTFTDFVDVAEALQERAYGRRNETIIYGGSAGGLLVGAAVNLRPELFGGVLAAVPFVDVLNTISDETLPLTPPEWSEWGNPVADPEAYETIAGYSPYDNIGDDVPYPPVLATGGIADYRVTYWEPAKWVARLRDEAKGGPFFLRMNMDAGHRGSAARFEKLEERAHEYAFALKLLGLTEREPVSHTSNR